MLTFRDIPPGSLLCIQNPIFQDGFTYGIAKRVPYGEHDSALIARVNEYCAINLNLATKVEKAEENELDVKFIVTI